MTTTRYKEGHTVVGTDGRTHRLTAGEAEKANALSHEDRHGYLMSLVPPPDNTVDLRLGSPQNVMRGLPEGHADRKATPIGTGVLDYFPAALAAVAQLSKAGNDQHNPGEPLHWARGKSSDHWDCIVRHGLQRGEIDDDGISHTAKVAWRALALLQEELEARAGWTPEEG